MLRLRCDFNQLTQRSFGIASTNPDKVGQPIISRRCFHRGMENCFGETLAEKSMYGSNKYIVSSSVKPTIPFQSGREDVLLRFNKHCDENNLVPDDQLAYRANFSCETALLKLTSNLLWVMEHQEVTPLVAIDLSAAFNTVDHDLLLSIVSKKFGVVNNALKWFDSYVRPEEVPSTDR